MILWNLYLFERHEFRSLSALDFRHDYSRIQGLWGRGSGFAREVGLMVQAYIGVRSGGLRAT